MPDRVSGRPCAMNTAECGVAGGERRDQCVQGPRRLLPERAGPPFVAFAVEAHDRVLAEVEVLDA